MILARRLSALDVAWARGTHEFFSTETSANLGALDGRDDILSAQDSMLVTRLAGPSYAAINQLGQHEIATLIRSRFDLTKQVFDWIHRLFPS
jgi:hypothetical protein